MSEPERESSRHDCGDCLFRPTSSAAWPCNRCEYSILSGYSLWQAAPKGEMRPGRIVFVDEMPTPMPHAPETILQEAQRLVHGDRGVDYGHPLDDFSRTAALFNTWKGNGMNLTAEDVAMFMVFVKLSREANKHKRDNMTDACGYAETYMMVRDERYRREASTETFGPLENETTA